MELIGGVSLVWLILLALCAYFLVSSGRRVLWRPLQLSAVPAALVQVGFALWAIRHGLVGSGLGLLAFVALTATLIWGALFRVEAAVKA